MIGGRSLRFHAKKELDSSSRFDIVPRRDKRTDRQTQADSIYRASIATCDKNVMQSPLYGDLGTGCIFYFCII